MPRWIQFHSQICRVPLNRLRVAAYTVAAAGVVTAVTGPAFAAPTAAAAVYNSSSSDHSPDSSDRVSEELRAALHDVVAAGASGVVLRVDDAPAPTGSRAGKPDSTRRN